jgi:plastocyanin
MASAVPAWSGDDGRAPPVASLRVSPERVVAGEPAALDASASRDPGGSVTSYAWDLDGDGSFEQQSGTQATLAHVFDQAGSHAVAVRVTGDSGASADAQAQVDVQAAEPKAAPEPTAVSARQQDAAAQPDPATRHAAHPTKPHAVAAATGAQPKGAAQPKAADRAKATRVSAASSQAVSIKDFSFGPRSVTVNVGDTVTWHNTGKQGHSATAKDGSFDTGVLATGTTGSATFRKAGTFSYFCKPHPFMTATVSVVATSGGGGGGGTTQGVTGSTGNGTASPGSGAGSGSSGSTASPGGGSLPRTGLAIGSFLMVGVAMIAAGVALRRQCATHVR